MTDPQLEDHCEHLSDLLTQAEYILKRTLNHLDPLNRNHRQHAAIIKEWVVQWRGARLTYGVDLVNNPQEITVEDLMSYIAYQKMIGIDTSKNEATHHVNFDWNGDEDKFEVYGTLYLTEGSPVRADVYAWATGGMDLVVELLRRFGEMGYPCSVVEEWGNGGRHVTFYLRPVS